MQYQYDTFYNTPINLRHEVKYLTKEFGYNVLYVRNNKFVKCTCFDDLNKCGDPSCKKCFGSGFFSSLQKIKVLEAANFQYQSENRMRGTSIGATEQKNSIFYIEQQYNPHERDTILKVTWDKNGIPIDIVKVLEIVSVRDMRGDDGRNEFNGCTINDRTDMVNEYQKILRTIPKKVLYEASKGGKGIWPMKL